MNKCSKWYKYKNKTTGDIVEAKQHQVFPELQTVTFDSGVANTEPLNFDIPINEFEQEYEVNIDD